MSCNNFDTFIIKQAYTYIQNYVSSFFFFKDRLFRSNLISTSLDSGHENNDLVKSYRKKISQSARRGMSILVIARGSRRRKDASKSAATAVQRDTLLKAKTNEAPLPPPSGYIYMCVAHRVRRNVERARVRNYDNIC